MIPLILTLILLSFLQATFLPFNLVLLGLVSRAFVVDEKENYYLAFFFGLLLSFLTGYKLGILSVIYLNLILAINIFRRMQFATHPLLIILVATAALFIDALSRSLMLYSSVNFWLIIPQVIAVLPVYFIVLFWEERFIPRKDTKLKVKDNR